MLNLESRQYAMLKEMGIDIPETAVLIELEQPSENKHVQTTTTKQPQDTSPASITSTNQNAQSPLEEAVTQQQIAAHSTAQPIPPAKPLTSTPPAPIAQADSERAQAIAKMSWEELEQTISQCNACALCQSRTQSVLGVGSREARWMIVGEAPGEQEDRQGEPFVGQAGKLLDNMLTQLGIARRPQGKEQPIYIANVLKCRPPRNRNPDPQEMAVCEAYLKRQIELLAPRVIIAMGRFAVQSLLQSHDAIGKLRGKIHHYQSTPVVVTYHPAYLLRNPVDKRKSWADLCLAANVFEKTVDDNQ